MGRNKPRRRESPTGAHRPTAAALPEGDGRVVWRMGRMDLDGRWGWRELAGEVLADLVKRCAAWESMHANEVYGQGGNKCIPLENLCRQAQRRLLELEADDLDELWELRMSGKQRIWGTREGSVFYPIWWDPEHTVCPSNLRNT